MYHIVLIYQACDTWCRGRFFPSTPWHPPSPYLSVLIPILIPILLDVPTIEMVHIDFIYRSPDMGTSSHQICC